MTALRVRSAAAKLVSMPLALLLAAFVLSPRVACAAGEAPATVIEYQDDLLTVRLQHVLLGDVLAVLAQKTGAEIRGELRNPREVSAAFEHVPLPEALSRLLGDQNFALVYGDGGRLRAVKLLGGPQPPGMKPPTLLSTPSTTPPAGAPTSLLAALQHHAPLPISGRLAEAFGANAATFQQLFEAAMHNEDAGVRADALRVALTALDAEPELRSSLIVTLNSYDDAALGGMLRGMAGNHAEELVLHVVTQAKASEIKVKASSVLQRLREQAASGS